MSYTGLGTNLVESDKDWLIYYPGIKTTVNSGLSRLFNLIGYLSGGGPENTTHAKQK